MQDDIIVTDMTVVTLHLFLEFLDGTQWKMLEIVFLYLLGQGHIMIIYHIKKHDLLNLYVQKHYIIQNIFPMLVHIYYYIAATSYQGIRIKSYSTQISSSLSLNN